MPLKYDDAGEFKDGMVKVCRDDKWGFINTEGEVVIPLEYEIVEDFC